MVMLSHSEIKKKKNNVLKNLATHINYEGNNFDEMIKLITDESLAKVPDVLWNNQDFAINCMYLKEYLNMSKCCNKITYKCDDEAFAIKMIYDKDFSDFYFLCADKIKQSVEFSKKILKGNIALFSKFPENVRANAEVLNFYIASDEPQEYRTILERNVTVQDWGLVPKEARTENLMIHFLARTMSFKDIVADLREDKRFERLSEHLVIALLSVATIKSAVLSVELNGAYWTEGVNETRVKTEVSSVKEYLREKLPEVLPSSKEIVEFFQKHADYIFLDSETINELFFENPKYSNEFNGFIAPISECVKNELSDKEYLNCSDYIRFAALKKTLKGSPTKKANKI